ncbi:MAG: hypothetical protein LUH21_04605 [Clostridiales bacterium]|nr:hypothetical protein [Clostridiales bacterium]
MITGCVIIVAGLVVFLFGLVWWLFEVIKNKHRDNKYLVANIVLCCGALVVNIGNIIIKSYR